MTLDEVISGVIRGYNSLISVMPQGVQSFVTLFFVVVLIVIYSVFIWKLHKFIGKKNIFELNLNQYNKSRHPAGDKLLASFFYVLEYVIILPLLILFWFGLFSIFLLLVMDLELKAILFISAAVIATIRVISYIPRYGESLARETAKLLPLNLLAIALLTPDFFNVERILNNVTKVGAFFGLILNYLLFIIILEIVLRFFELILDLFGIKDTGPKETEND